MKRGVFVASAAATAAIAAVPGAALAISVEAATPALRFFECDSSYWVVAASLAEAKLVFAEEVDAKYDNPDDPGDVSYVREIKPDEHFTMMFDELPEGLTADYLCKCTGAELKKWHGCGCEAGDNSVTMTAAEWVNGPIVEMRRRKIIYEYRG